MPRPKPIRPRARQQLANTVVALQSRLKPSALARDAIEELKEVGGEIAQAGVDTIKRHPVPTIGVIAALTAFFARKPLRAPVSPADPPTLMITSRTRNAR